MNLARLASTMLKARVDPSWHPGAPPDRPKKPGKRAGVIPWMLWRYENHKWRNHDKKESPFWDWYRGYLKCEYWLLVRAAKLEAAGYQCEKRQGGKRCPETKNLQCHHKPGAYKWVGNEMEHLSCLVVLCKYHHDMAHGAGAEGLLSRKGRDFLKRLIG